MADAYPQAIVSVLDKLALRPAAGSVPRGSRFTDIDTGVEYVSDGANWRSEGTAAGGVLYGPIANRPAPAAAVADGTLFIPTDAPVAFQLRNGVWRPWLSQPQLGASPPTIAGATWTVVNPHASISFADGAGAQGGGIDVQQIGADASNTNRHLLVRPIGTAGAWTRTMNLIMGLPGAGPAAGAEYEAGICLRDSVSGNFYEWQINVGAGSENFTVLRMTSPTVVAGTLRNKQILGGPDSEGQIAFQVQFDGANYIFSYRAFTTGMRKEVFAVEAAGAFITADQVGFVCNGTTTADQTQWINPMIIGWDGAGGAL